MSDGALRSIPVVYYGQEQGFSGNADPVGSMIMSTSKDLLILGFQWNREPLWPSGYANTSTYQLTSKLNTVC